MHFLFLKLNTGIVVFCAFAGTLHLSKPWFLSQSSSLTETFPVKSLTSVQHQAASPTAWFHQTVVNGVKNHRCGNSSRQDTAFPISLSMSLYPLYVYHISPTILRILLLLSYIYTEREFILCCVQCSFSYVELEFQS